MSPFYYVLISIARVEFYKFIPANISIIVTEIIGELLDESVACLCIACLILLQILLWLSPHKLYNFQIEIPVSCKLCPEILPRKLPIDSWSASASGSLFTVAIAYIRG